MVVGGGRHVRGSMVRPTSQPLEVWTFSMKADGVMGETMKVRGASNILSFYWNQEEAFINMICIFGQEVKDPWLHCFAKKTSVSRNHK